MPAIKVKDLTKDFKGFVAVDKISFEVERGELFGLLGPNGAGKTTIINMLTTLLRPSFGSAEVAGFDVIKERDEVRQSIGVVFQESAVDSQLTGRENLKFHAMMYNIKRDEIKKRIEMVLKLAELTDKADVLVDNYSGGMRRRLEIARGLIQHPKVLFLDEPTVGLDAQTRRHIWEYIIKLNKENNVTVILTTHYMEEADFLCRRIAIVDHGKIVALDTPKNLKDTLGGDVISLGIRNYSNDLVRSFESVSWIKKVKKHDGFVDLTVNKGETKIPEIIQIAQKLNILIQSVNLHKPSLEDVFLYFTGKTIREHEASQGEKSMNKMKIRMKMRH